MIGALQIATDCQLPLLYFIISLELIFGHLTDPEMTSRLMLSLTDDIHYLSHKQKVLKLELVSSLLLIKYIVTT